MTIVGSVFKGAVLTKEDRTVLEAAYAQSDRQIDPVKPLIFQYQKTNITGGEVATIDQQEKTQKSHRCVII